MTDKKLLQMMREYILEHDLLQSLAQYYKQLGEPQLSERDELEFTIGFILKE